MEMSSCMPEPAHSLIAETQAGKASTKRTLTRMMHLHLVYIYPVPHLQWAGAKGAVTPLHRDHWEAERTHGQVGWHLLFRCSAAGAGEAHSTRLHTLLAHRCSGRDHDFPSPFPWAASDLIWTKLEKMQALPWELESAPGASPLAFGYHWFFAQIQLKMLYEPQHLSSNWKIQKIWIQLGITHFCTTRSFPSFLFGKIILFWASLSNKQS